MIPCIYFITIMVLVILLYTYGKNIEWQKEKEIDNKFLLFTKKIKDIRYLSILKNNSELFYVFSINSLVASSVLLIIHMDSDPIVYLITFILVLIVWFISLSLKFGTTEKIEKYIDEFLIAIDVSLIFTLIDNFDWIIALFSLIISIMIFFKLRRSDY